VPEQKELRRQIDDLAVQLVVGGMDASEGWPSSCVPALEQIRETANRAHAQQVAAVATSVLEAIQEAGAGTPGVDSATTLQEGVSRLQEAVEREGQAGAKTAPSGSAAGGTPAAKVSLAQDPELLSDFIVESREYLTAIEAQVLTLERDPCDSEALHSVFRGFHTIKGLAGFLELWDVQKLSHEVEAILDRARNFQLTLSGTAIDAILQSADHLQRWLMHLETGLRNQPSTAPEWDEDLFSRVRALSSSPAAADSAPKSVAQSAPDFKPQPAPESVPESVPDFKPEFLPDSAPEGLSSMASAVAGGGAAPEGTVAAGEASPAPAERARTERRSETLAIKVDTAKLDYLADMAGEMVIAESLVRHDPELNGTKNPRLQRNLAQLKRITTELQKTAMAMRLVPIGPLFRRMARLVRDLSLQFDKQVGMETEGDEIELDRTIVEALADPLMHMVRNALDHGIEHPKERLAQGKSVSARLLLRAQHQAGHVVIEIADDGRGLDREKILAKALQKGLIASAEGMTDSEVFNLVFEPGFSTAAQVTNVSGRGVGMDVVRRNVEKLRGRIEIRSTAHVGSSFLLKLPLTLAMIDGLVVGVGAEQYIVPLFAVREMFRPTEDTIWTVQQRSEMALVRDALLPVVRLYRRFHVKPKSEDPKQSVLIVAESESRRFCLLVDDLIGKQEVVIKSLGETFKNIPGIAGGAIMGDGRVGLILELDRLFKDRNV
jgi:two-component system chemotaxis sensor kinase CheA